MCDRYQVTSGGAALGFCQEKRPPLFPWHLADCEYRRFEILAPSEEMFSAYRKDKNWMLYAQRYEALMRQREIPAALDRAFFEETPSCLMCSEATSEKCHRRVLAEMLANARSDVEVIHLV